MHDIATCSNQTKLRKKCHPYTMMINLVTFQCDASGRGKKELKPSRDKRCKAQTVVGRGGEEPAM